MADISTPEHSRRGEEKRFGLSWVVLGIYIGEVVALPVVYWLVIIAGVQLSAAFRIGYAVVGVLVTLTLPWLAFACLVITPVGLRMRFLFGVRQTRWDEVQWYEVTDQGLVVFHRHRAALVKIGVKAFRRQDEALALIAHYLGEPGPTGRTEDAALQ